MLNKNVGQFEEIISDSNIEKWLCKKKYQNRFLYKIDPLSQVAIARCVKSADWERSGFA